MGETEKGRYSPAPLFARWPVDEELAQPDYHERDSPIAKESHRQDLLAKLKEVQRIKLQM